MKLVLQVFTSLIVFTALPLHAAGDAAAGKQNAATCAACHGIDGNSAVAMWPTLAGQHAAYLERQIALIRDGQRPVPEMAALVAGLSDDDIADLAAYFAGQSASPGAADEALAARGERIYRAGNPESGVPACMACHGPGGEGNPLAGYPALAGQHATYTAKMLNGFRAGTTWGEDDASSIMMAGVAAELSEEEVSSVASYIQGLHQAE